MFRERIDARMIEPCPVRGMDMGFVGRDVLVISKSGSSATLNI